MSSNNTIYSTQPLGSRPPFATDDDHLYEETAQPTRRIRQPSPEDPNVRTSAYDMYNQYIDEKHGGDTYQGDMNDDPFDDRNQPRQKHKPTPIPLAAPRPGYAAQVTALNLSTPTSPSRAASPDGRSSPSHPRPLMLVESMNSPISPRMPSPGHNVPATPHPLPPTITPIQPVFARPSKNVDDRDVKFASQPILRGEKEETLLPRRGERGDDFWRRFSMVVHQEGTTQQKESPWLRKTQNGSTRLTRWVWVIGLLLLIAIAGGIGLGVFISSKDKTHDAPKAIGGSANEKLQTESSSAAVDAQGSTISSSFHVSPTRTVARREDETEPTVIATFIPRSSSSFSDAQLVRPVPPSRHRRVLLNRTGE